MSAKARTTFYSLAIIMVLVFSAVRPHSASADDGTPPEVTATQVTEEAQSDGGTETVPTEGVSDPQPTGEAASEPAADPAATEEAALVEGEATPEPTLDPATSGEAAPSVDVTTPTDPAQEPQPTEEAAPLPDLSAVPANTDVTVLDENGQALPLATQETADVIATSDPIWCPGSQTPTPGQNGCTQSFSSFDALLTFLSGNVDVQQAGTIYVEQGAYQGNDPNNVIDFNNYDLSNISSFDLAVTGGWNTSNNTVDPNTPSTFDGYSIIIGSSTNPWSGSLTLSNIDVTGSLNNGIELYSTTDVNVDNVRSDRNLQTGAVIRAGRNVNVRNSVFGNGDTFTARVQMAGLDIESGATTSLFSVVTNDNYTFGTNILAGGSVFISGTIDSNSTFSGNQDIFGTDVDPIFVGHGLQVTATGDIVLANVTANDNYLWGASLDAGGNISISDSVFNGNSTDQPGFIDDTGLFITGGQAVSLNNVTASENRLYGAQINVDGPVSIVDSNFNNNRGVTTIGGVTEFHGHGLQINTLSDINIQNTNANNNMLFGGELTAGGQVAIQGGSFSDTTTAPEGTVALGQGLKITSTGNTSLDQVVLNNNQTEGADIQAGGDVFLTGVTATNNGSDGILVDGTCVHVTGGTYSGNGQYGLNLGSSPLDLISSPVFSSNVAGNIFPATPVSCAPPLVTPGTSPVNNNAGAANLFAGKLALTSANSGMSSNNISLISFLANQGTAASSFGTFIGIYTYVDTKDGLQIYVLSPVSQQVAMTVP